VERQVSPLAPNYFAKISLRTLHPKRKLKIQMRRIEITIRRAARFGLGWPCYQALLLGGLIWYCIETRRIRIVSTAQLEALQAPCLTLVATLRGGSEAVLDTAGARGTLVLDFNEGFFLAGIVATTSEKCALSIRECSIRVRQVKENEVRAWIEEIRCHPSGSGALARGRAIRG
jgi:hypothetical protein